MVLGLSLDKGYVWRWTRSSNCSAKLEVRESDKEELDLPSRFPCYPVICEFSVKENPDVDIK